jgi:hypothetical protein
MDNVAGQQVKALRLISTKAGHIKPGEVGTVLRQQTQLGRPMLQVKFPTVDSTVMVYHEEVETA